MRTKYVVFLLYFYLSVVVISIFLGFSFADDNVYTSLEGQKVELIGNIVSTPEINNSGSQIIIFKPEDQKQFLRISLFRPSYLKNGDRVVARGRINLPENFSRFNYVRYLQMRGVYAELRSPVVLVLESEESIWERVLRITKAKVVKRIRQAFDSDQSGLILGMLIGETGDLSKSLYQSYSKVGLTHILVVSGFNLTIIATSLSYLSKIVSRQIATMVSLASIWFFVFLTGASSGVVRAGIMATIFLLARSYGRINSSFYALLLTTVFITIINPLRLLYDIGLQLSISATYGVLSVYRIQSNINLDSKLLEFVFPTVGAIVFTMPLVAFYFGTLSIISPVANFVVLPFIPLEMLLGSLSLVPMISNFSNHLLQIILAAQNWLVNYLANLPWSQLAWEPTVAAVCIYYCVVLFVERQIIHHSKPRLKNTLDSGTITEIII